MKSIYRQPSHSWTDETLDKLGNCFVHFQIGKRYGISFERYLQLVTDGMWADVVGAKR